MLRARLMKYFIAIKSEVTGVNRAAAVSCQNESGSCWLKLIGPSQTMIWIETLDTCNKDIQPELRCVSPLGLLHPPCVPCYSLETSQDGVHVTDVTNVRNVNTTPHQCPAHCSAPTTLRPAAGLDYGLTTDYTPIVVFYGRFYAKLIEFCFTDKSQRRYKLDTRKYKNVSM